MEVVQGKSTNKKVVIAQEIAFAKVLAGNNKTLRDRGVKKLKKWLRLRGNGKWKFTEEEFLRIWTGLFYCMWMSDKFLIQEELAETISSFIHCFKKNTECALLFIKCYNKRILMDWEGLDQYRIDKFHMFSRRFLRQTFIYCKKKDWNEVLLIKLMGIFYNIILNRQDALGYVLHFISMYLEELAKVSKGKLDTKTVITLVEPFAKVIARSKDVRVQKEAEEFFLYLIKQTDTGIEFEEKLRAWKEHGYPGEGPHCMKSVNIPNDDDENDLFNESDNDNDDDDDEDLNDPSKPMDPRAGSVHVMLPQIPVDVDSFLDLFKKYKNSKFSNHKGRNILKTLIQKYEVVRKGKFPMRIRKDPILDEKKKKKQTVRNASKLLKFTQEIDKNPIQTEEFRKMSKELEEQNESDDNEVEEQNESDEELNETQKSDESEDETNESNDITETPSKLEKENNKKKKQNKSSTSAVEVKENRNDKEACNLQKTKKRNRKKKRKILQESSTDEHNLKKKKFIKKNKIENTLQPETKTENKILTTNKILRKRKILSNWQIQELDKTSSEYYEIKTPKIIRLEKKLSENWSGDESTADISKQSSEEKPAEEVLPAFWSKAREKLNQKSGKKNKNVVNLFENVNGESKRRISFALDKNMAQENDQYLEEVKNSPKVPFDGSKKPIQSALKSGLAPSPVNPFYRFKKIKF